MRLRKQAEDLLGDVQEWEWTQEADGKISEGRYTREEAVCLLMVVREEPDLWTLVQEEGALVVRHPARFELTLKSQEPESGTTSDFLVREVRPAAQEDPRDREE